MSYLFSSTAVYKTLESQPRKKKTRQIIESKTLTLMYSHTATLTIAINEWIFIPSSLIWAHTTSSNHFTISFSGHFFHRRIVKIIAVLSSSETATAWSYNFMILWSAVHSRTAFSTYEAHIKRLTSLLIKGPWPKSKNFGPKTNDFLEEKSKNFWQNSQLLLSCTATHTQLLSRWWEAPHGIFETFLYYLWHYITKILQKPSNLISAILKLLMWNFILIFYQTP